MRSRTAAALCLALLLPGLAGPAEALVLAGAGTGQAAFTICFNLNVVQFNLAGVAVNRKWTMVGTLVSLHPQCRPTPVHVFEGTWDPLIGGCDLVSAEYRLCLYPAGLGSISWSLCRPSDQVCDELHRIFFGTLNGVAV